ncbi:plasmid pRiA4b ORF-3 family protein [Pectinatus frisingensis]|uniref:plasmid pRiA4b ORF-3 family protein n=1 Tax=Pectinatus frisingensis TaxID=865 RepID=UPI0015F6A371|nr:plasmid pRiA4b ORF-3 family protein [Pectinatus frisingensis]
MKAYQIKIELVDSKPLIWRRVIIPADVTFKRLHDTIQFAMDWWDSHLYEFEFPQEKLRITNDKEAYEAFKFYQKKFKGKTLTKHNDPHGFIARTLETVIRQPQTIKIDRYLEEYKTLTYIYDFGDDWQHQIKLEKIIAEYQFGYPTILEGEGACPPEDVGGIPGYEKFLRVWNDPKHPDHEEMHQWGESQHYRDFDIAFENNLLKTCLKIKTMK